MSERRRRLLFLAWGDSIHARRRIQIFVDDPTYEVAVVSTHDYAFAGARNYLLDENQASGGRRARVALRILRDRSESSMVDLPHELAAAAHDLSTLRRAVGEFRPDAVWLQTLLYPCYLGYALPRSLPLIITFWNGDVIWWAQWNGIERRLKKQIVTYGVRRATMITVNSKMAVDACLSYGAEPKNVHLIRYPGVDLQRFQPASSSEARRSLGIEARRVVFSPRGLGGYLNAEVIIAAAARVANRERDVLFVFAAPTTELIEHYRTIARELGVEQNCRFEGAIAWERMPLYYAAADVMVSMSSKDSLPNCMLEAMACGTPIVMSDIPQIREWITDGHNGWLVPCHDADSLAARIMTVFESVTQQTAFRDRNLEVVREHADSRKNIAQLKDALRVIDR